MVNIQPRGRHRQHVDLLKSFGSKKNDPKLLITHRFKVDRIFDAYKTFGPAANTKALKVIIEA